MSETNLFTPYRSLGLICSSGLIYCALGKQLCGYTVNPLRLAFIACSIDSEISLVAADSLRVYIACNFGFVIIFKNNELKHRLKIPNEGAKLLLSLTETLVVVDKKSVIYVFDVQDGQLIVQLESPASFEITAIVHPHTYLNKILVGSSDGRMRILNMKSGKLVHEFPANDNFSSPIRVLEQSTAIDVIGVGMANGQIHLRNIKFDKVLCSFRQSGQITALAFRTDGVDTLASANSEGAISVWNLEERILIGQLSQAHKGPIIWLHFLLGQPLLLSSGEDNKIVKWFFRNENSLPEVNTVLEGHSAPATALKFYAENFIVSASRDGHVRQFNLAKMHGAKDFGMAREVRRGTLSQDRFIDVPLETIMQIEVSAGREAVWDNMICRHEASPLVSTWRTRHMRRGTHLLYHERFGKRPELLTAFASSIFISNCGNFALIGYSSGHVDVFNMQSGKYKFSLEAELKDKETIIAGRDRRKKKSNGCAHEALVSGVVLDLFNRNVVTGAADGTIHFWQFRQPPTLYSKIRVTAGVRLFRMDLQNSLLAVGLENGELGVVDILCRKLARRLPHYGCMDWSKQTHLTALEFSNDGKWLLSADNLGFIKVWDLASGMLLDVMHCMNPCIGLAFNERDNYLATLHDGQRGIYLWANKQMFTASSIISKSAEQLHENVAKNISLPSISARQEEEEEANDKEEDIDDDQSETNTSECSQIERIVTIDEDEDMDADDEIGTETTLSRAGTSCSFQSTAILLDKEQLNPKLYTLSGLATSRWQGLPLLELIRQRNKPKETPKKPISAPFFMPTMDNAGGAIQFDKANLERLKEAERNEEQVQEKRHIAVAQRRFASSEKSEWIQSLLSANTFTEFHCVFAQLKDMSLSGLDFQFRLLDDTVELTQFLAMLIAILETKRDFDLVQSYLATFLNIHHEQLWNVVNNEETAPTEDNENQMEREETKITNCEKQHHLTNNLQRICELVKQAADELQCLFDQSLSLAEYIKSALI